MSLCFVLDTVLGSEDTVVSFCHHGVYSVKEADSK